MCISLSRETVLGGKDTNEQLKVELDENSALSAAYGNATN